MNERRDESEEARGSQQPLTPEHVGEDQFIHGMLGLAHQEMATDRQRRIDSVFERIDREDGLEARPGKWTPWKVLSSLAASLVVGVSLFFVLFGGESALAYVSSAIEASGLFDRRYRMEVHLDPALNQEPHHGFLDYRDPEHFLLHGPTSNFAVGVCPEGSWLRSVDGSVELMPQGGAASEQLGVAQTLAMVEGVDALFHGLRKAYSYEIGPVETLEGRSGNFQKVEGRALDPQALFADRIELWIESKSLMLQKLVLTWDNGVGDELFPFPHRLPIDVSRLDSSGETEPRIEEMLGVSPQQIIFDLVEHVTFEDGWFEPFAR